MKKLFFAIMALAAIAFAGCCGKAGQTKPEHPSFSWSDSTTAKYRYDKNVNQLVLVQYTGGHDAIVRMFVKSYQDTMPVWTEKLVCAGYVGRDGLVVEPPHRNYQTPTGDYGMITAFGIKPNPGTSLPYIDVTEYTYSCDMDCPFFNMIIDYREHPEACVGEHMMDFTPYYNYGFFFDYNKEQNLDLNSSIFFHCTGQDLYTAGCIAVSEEDMVTILQNIDMGARLIINYL